MSTNAGISCLTCKYGKSTCDHVKKVKCLTLDGINIPLHLKPFCQSSHPTTTSRFESNHKCQSYKCIPFECTLELSEIICKPDVDRFRISADNVCHLMDEGSSDKCPHCSSTCFPTTYPSSCIVITSKKVYPAKGLHFPNFICHRPNHMFVIHTVTISIYTYM